MDKIDRNGIRINQSKFEFCEDEMHLAGFLVTNTSVKPLPKYLDAKATFPRPTNVSDIRSWLGPVNQVSHYAKLSDLMAPFKPFLLPKYEFRWADTMEEAFMGSKEINRARSADI